MTGSKSRSSPSRLRLSGLVAALIAGVLILPLGAALRTPLFDLWQRISPRDLSDTKVRVVLIDSASLAAIGPWPWPRSYLAELTHQLTQRGVSAIGFDMLFAEPDRLGPRQVARFYRDLPPGAVSALTAQPAPDDQFALAISGGPVVLARAGTFQAQGSAPPDADDGLPDALPAGFLRYPRMVAAIPELDMVAAGHGLINAEPDGDGLYRELPLLAQAGGKTVAGLAIETARIATGAGPPTIADRSVRLGRTAIPVTSRGEMRLRLGRFPAARQISAFELFDPNARADLREAAVLVGLAAEGTVDVAATPLENAQYGVLIQAQALDAILRGQGWLERPRWALAAEWAAAALLVVLALWLLPRRGRWQWIVPGAALAVFAGWWIAFVRGALLLDPIPSLALTAASAVGITLASFQQTRRERERLREALVDERVATAANEAELDAARAIQQAMLPRAEALARLDPRVTVAATLSPAKSVGGDFYDVVALESGRLGFAIGDVTGKGVPAALFMALSKALAKSALLREPLEGLAPAIQTELSRDAPDEMGLTMVIGALDLATGEALLINAGHDNPFKVGADGSVAEVAMEGGPPFCITDYDWPVEPLTLKPGDTLVLFTDGVTEAQDDAGSFFGRARAAAALRGGGPDALIAGLTEAVRAFEAGTAASDDLTVMAVRWGAGTD